MLKGEKGTFALLLAMSFSLVLTTDWTDCAKNCQCKWISGKKNALCREAGYVDIPNNLSSEIQILDLCGNSIPTIRKDAFKQAGLLNLQKVYLQNVGLRQIDKEAFRELTILVEVDLSNNFIKTLLPSTFIGNERLKILSVNENPLTELQAFQFPHLPHLKTLEFQNCRIKFVHHNAFHNTAALESLNLNGNQLNHLSAMAFASTPNLKTLLIDGNPWNCDCQLRSFRNWLLQSKLYSHSLTCHYPAAFESKRWEYIDPMQFACEPRISTSEIFVQAEPGANATFTCFISGDPEPEVTWLFNGNPINGSGNGARAGDSAGYGSAGNADGVQRKGGGTDEYMIEESFSEANKSKSSTLSIFAVNETDAGDYTCQGQNLRGHSMASVSLVMPKEPVATTMKRTESWWFLYTAFLSVSIVVAVCAVSLTLVCHLKKRSLKKERRKRSKLKTANDAGGSVTLSDQDKRLLDASITTTSDRATESCGGYGSQQDMELIEQTVQGIPIELREPPLHITIESHHAPHHAVDRSVAVFPPPPEYTTGTILPSGASTTAAFGNIFISVSVGQEPTSSLSGESGSDVYGHQRYRQQIDRVQRRYPDLLEISRTSNVLNAGVGTSSEPLPISHFATLPRNSGAIGNGKLTIAGNPQYDNMGPRVTANGSSIISLPKTVSMEDIPTPPPPPICSSLNVEITSNLKTAM